MDTDERGRGVRNEARCWFEADECFLCEKASGRAQASARAIQKVYVCVCVCVCVNGRERRCDTERLRVCVFVRAWPVYLLMYSVCTVPL